MEHHPHDPSLFRRVWGGLYVSNGALLLFGLLFLFMVATYKIDQASQAQARQVSASVCGVITQADKGVDAQRHRVQNAIKRNQDRLEAQRHIASVWSEALDKTPKDSPSYALIKKVSDGEQQLVNVSKGDVDDLKTQLANIKPIVLKGC